MLFVSTFSCACLYFTDWNIRSWSRGEPGDISIPMVAHTEDKIEADDEKVRTPGRILWIRGLTRLQAQVMRC